MGVENNECVLATTWNQEAVELVKEWIKTRDSEEQSLFAIVPALINKKNNYYSCARWKQKGMRNVK